MLLITLITFQPINIIWLFYFIRNNKSNDIILTTGRFQSACNKLFKNMTLSTKYVYWGVEKQCQPDFL